ncbi:MAG: hypothetical protein GC182_08265 [Rhodopseudomonas sp.]|nr:hypothetical protein [Rhodopseudomonas sp.]
MKRWVIWLLAVVFVVNGAVSLASIDLPDLPAAVGHADRDAMATVRHQTQAKTGGPSQRGCDEIATAAPDRDPVQHDDKCCPTCTMPSMLPLATVSAVAFSSTAQGFLPANDEMVGHLVLIDPDIPKVAV